MKLEDKDLVDADIFIYSPSSCFSQIVRKADRKLQRNLNLSQTKTFLSASKLFQSLMETISFVHFLKLIHSISRFPRHFILNVVNASEKSKGNLAKNYCICGIDEG